MVCWLHLQTVWTQIRPDKCRLLIRPDKKQNAICWLHLQTFLTQSRPYKLSPADYNCNRFGPRSGQTKCPLLIIFANSLNPDQAQQNVLCFANSLNPYQVRRNAKCSLWTLIRLNKIMSAGYICQQFGHRSGPTNVVCWSGLIKCKMSSADYICEQFWHSQGPTIYHLGVITLDIFLKTYAAISNTHLSRVCKWGKLSGSCLSTFNGFRSTQLPIFLYHIGVPTFSSQNN